MSERAVALDELEPGSPEYLSLKYLEAIKAQDFMAAKSYASRNCIAQQRWQLEGNSGVAQNISRMSFTHIVVNEETTKRGEKNYELHFYVQSEIDAKPYWTPLSHWFLKMNGKWLLVSYAEYHKGKLFPKELDPPLSSKP